MTTRVGFVNEELYNWHRAGDLNYSEKFVEPMENWENEGTKRRFANLMARSGLIKKVHRIEARAASREEICAFHTEDYHDMIENKSNLERGGNGGEAACFQYGGYEIAALSAGGVLAACEAVNKGEVDTAYCLVRPPGHHARRDFGMGFCLFNNITIAALKLKEMGRARIDIIDYDVHHGNGTEQAFYDDPNVLFVSIHQDNNYPQQGSGNIMERGSELGKDPRTGKYTTINIPLPPGSGQGAYRYAFDEVVLPSVRLFNPDFILVSSGFDASYTDCLGAMMLSSADYAYFTRTLCDLAKELCEGRIVFAHEGGYSKDYVPFCGVSVIQTLLGMSEEDEGHVADPYLDEVSQWGYQELQNHQLRVVDTVAMLHGMKGMDVVVKNQLNSLLLGELTKIPGLDMGAALSALSAFNDKVQKDS